MNQQKIIGFDMDGVIIDHSQNKMFLAKNLGFELTPKQTASGVIKSFLPAAKMGNFLSVLYDNPELALNAPLMEGSKEAFEMLNKQNISYFLISRRKNPVLAVDLLQARGLWPKYFNQNNTFFVITPEDKEFVAKRLGITHYFDDELKVLNVLESVPNKFLYDQFGNFPESGYKTVRSWGEVMSYII